MSVQGINNSSSVAPLRLVQPPQQKQPMQQVQPAQRVAGDSYDFQSVRETQLPRMSLTPAHQRLEKLRDLIAAKTDVPIHFDGPTMQTSSANPYSGGYLKFPVNAADRNAAATDAHTV